MLLVAESHQTNVNGSGTGIWRRREEREIEHGRAWEKTCALCDGLCESQSALSRNIFAYTVQVRVCRDEGYESQGAVVQLSNDSPAFQLMAAGLDIRYTIRMLVVRIPG